MTDEENRVIDSRRRAPKCVSHITGQAGAASASLVRRN